MVVVEGTSGPAVVTGQPARLAMFARSASIVEDDLVAEATSLGAALDGLRDSTGWSEFLPAVPPMDLHVRTTGARLEKLAQDVDSFGHALQRLDGRPGPAGPAFAVPWLSRREQPVFERDGTLHVVGSDVGEHVRLRFEDGRWAVTITTVDGLTTTHVAIGQVEQVVVLAGSGHDVVDVPANCTVSFVVDAGDGDDLVGHLNAAGVVSASSGSDGDDRLFMGAGDDVALGGRGDDRIHMGAAGPHGDYADGGDGDDQVTAGAGYAALYGGRGDDTVRGGADGDLVEGGSGDDRVDGEGGDDIVSGGRGDDRLFGRAGDDALLGGAGDDVAAAGDGVDRGHVESEADDADAELRVTVAIDATAGGAALALERPSWMTDDEWGNWLERIDADLMLLRSTRTGLDGLRALDRRAARTDAQVQLVPDGLVSDDPTWSPVRESRGARGSKPELERRLSDGVQGNSSFARPETPGRDRWILGGMPRFPQQVGLDPLATTAHGPLPSAIVLFHELVHSYDQMGGRSGVVFTEWLVDSGGRMLLDSDGEPMRLVRNVSELNAVGIDLDGDGQHDGFPTRQGATRPSAFTGNAIRDELRLFRRQSYLNSLDPRASTVRIVVHHPEGDQLYSLPIEHEADR